MTRIKLFPFLFISIGVVIFSSCNPGTYRPLFQSKYDVIQDTLQTVHIVNSKAPYSDVYRIQPNDMLSIRNQPIELISESSGTSGSGGGGSSSGGAPSGFRVEEDGTVHLPRIGKVYVKDLSRKEATDKIQSLFREAQLVDPVFDVSVLAQKVSILGEVNSTGSFYLEKENTSLTEILALAGGFKASADPRLLKIIRGNKSDPEIIYVNVRNLSSLVSSKIIMQNNDVVYVMPDKKTLAYEKTQSFFGVFQYVLTFLSAGLLVYTSFIK